jgi:hypothetical protein
VHHLFGADLSHAVVRAADLTSTDLELATTIGIYIE